MTTQTKPIFARIDADVVNALSATARRLGCTQAKILERALSTELLTLSNSGESIKEADARYESEILRLSRSAQALIDGVSAYEAQKRDI